MIIRPIALDMQCWHKHMKTEVGIVGAGIIGLTTAVKLLQDGRFDVTLISRDPVLHSNSDAAVAKWYAPDNKKPLLQQLCIESLSSFQQLRDLPASGVYYIPVAHYFTNQPPPSEDGGLQNACKADYLLKSKH